MEEGVVGGSEYKDVLASEPKKDWTLIISGIAFVILILSVGAYYLISSLSTSNVTESQISQGYSTSISEGKTIKFDLINESHSIKVTSVNDTSVEIMIKSNPIFSNFTIGEEKKFDINGDGIYDLSIKLNSIEKGKPNLTIRKISENISQTQNQVANNASNNQNSLSSQTCVENWNCEDWTECIVGGQTRLCTDANNCGTFNNVPIRAKACDSNNLDTSTNSCEPRALGDYRCQDGNVYQEYQNTDCTKYWRETITCGSSYICAELPDNNVTCVNKDYGKSCSNTGMSCMGGLKCNFGKCVTAAELVDECKSGSDCGVCENCSSGYKRCVETGYDPNDYSKTYYACGGECTFDSSCKSGYECSSNKCVAIEQPAQECTPNWECSPWGECTDGTQYLEVGAICNDLNSCANAGMPPYSRSC